MEQCRQTGCDPAPPQLKGSEKLHFSLKNCLGVPGMPLDALERLAQELRQSIRKHQQAANRWSPARLHPGDIAVLIQSAHNEGALDEAYWRSFLAAHFGRCSIHSKTGTQDSAGRLLRGFGSEPVWTWQVVQGDPAAFREWLGKHQANLKSLSFGNHRKFESQKPRNLWQVIDSFFTKVAQCGGSPTKLFTAAAGDAGNDQERFSVLFERLRGIKRFGRTGRFDWLTFLADLKLLDVRPDSCHLKGSTGPLAGARRLWGDQPVKELENLANKLAKGLKVSPQVIEDALCNWQK